ncbi:MULTISPECIES: hypothetical protein [Peribacillus]|nr:hypothetical protein [Peribacillus asahii]USK70118.1 hypothetical protein LIS76_21955 [Peribacillus asahii]USK85021.1 hypothetical protein LIT35_22130 [Peribacillus asahii]
MRLLMMIIGCVFTLVVCITLYEHQLGAIAFLILSIICFAAAYRQRKVK